MTLSAGDQVSDTLVLEREIGKGGMGTVWVAKNSALGSRVAVKVLQTVGGEVSLEARKRFEAEARGLAQLDHPNLVRIFDFGMSPDGHPFIVMELLRGEDLSQRLASGPLDLETTANILRQTCRALGRAHDQGVIHRDIKPANIFLMQSDGEILVKVLDFGVARFGDSSPDMATKTGTLVGTPFFMSPEQHMNPKGIDHRADLWSVAVVVYACLTGDLPFKGETITSLGVAVLQGQRPSVRSLRPELPAAIDIWMDRALARDPAGRYSSATELAEAFDRARAASPTHVASVQTAPSSVDPRAPSFATSPTHHAAMNAPTRPVGVAAQPLPNPPSLAAPLPIAVAAPYPQPSMPAPVTATPMQPKRSGSSGAVIGGVIAALVLGGAAVGGWLVFGKSGSSAPSDTAATTATSKSKTKTSSTADDAKAASEPTSKEPAPTATAKPESTAANVPGTSDLAPAGKPPATTATAAGTTPTTKPSATATATPTATAAPAAATRSGAPANGILSGCWRGNADKGTPASSATATFHVDANGKTSAIVIAGPARSVGNFTACCVSGIAALGFGPGAAETVSTSASFAAVK